MSRALERVTARGAAAGPARAPLILLGVLLLAASYMLGTRVGEEGTEALFQLVAAIAFAALLFRPELGVLLLSASIALETALLLGDGLTGPRVVGLALFAAWIAHKVIWREPWRRVYGSSFFVAGGAFVLFVASSLLWSWFPEVSVRGFFQLAQLLVWALILIDLTPSWERADQVARALVAGALVAAALTVFQSLGGMKRAGDDIAGGVNATAMVLLTLLPFAFYLLRAHASRTWRLLALAYLALATVAIVLTFSRLNMLLLVPLLALLCLDTLRSGRGRKWLLGFAAVGAAVAMLAVPWDRVVERAQTITPYLSRSVGGPTNEDPTSSSRAYHFRVGFAIARDHPVLGVGYNNYGHLFLKDYQFTTSGATKLYHSARSPHSSHVGIVADLGLVGLALWLTLIGVMLRNVALAWKRTRRHRGSPRHAFVQAVTYALLLHALPFALYMPNQKEKLVWTVFALTVVVARLAAADARREGAGARVPAARGAGRRPSAPGARGRALPVPEGA